MANPLMVLRDGLFWIHQQFSRGASKPRWRVQTSLQASARLFLDRRTLNTAGQALRASERRDTLSERLRFAWTRCWEFESHWLLGVQAERITMEWVRQRVEVIGEPLPPGAVLVCPHHLNQRLGFLRLAEGRDLAMVLNNVSTSRTERVPDQRQRPMAWARAYSEGVGALYQCGFHRRLFSGRASARAALQHVRAGGSVIIAPDMYPGTSQTGSILGRELPLALGPAWVARQANAPLIPFVLLPFKSGRWQLWSGSPVDPTKRGLEHALSHAISLSPTNWMFWEAWSSAPAAAA